MRRILDDSLAQIPGESSIETASVSHPLDWERFEQSRGFIGLALDAHCGLFWKFRTGSLQQVVVAASKWFLSAMLSNWNR
jgi:hypothetical protein